MHVDFAGRGPNCFPPVKEVKSNSNTNGGFRTAECLHTSEINGLSVSLALVQKNAGSPNARDPKEYWNTSFGRYENKALKREDDEKKAESLGEREREEAEKSIMPLPRKIDGLGEGAFWAPDFTGGALYVLKGNAFVRISIAGSESEESKIDKSKALAAKALARF